ncbi:MAG: 4Fe-4S dicluster domain-containing protein [Candidatus Altiarchaeota archaeon]|nr:4Fe-4S dicluster domain-containing protein [Candidatus Altiarchaeota archaeon]
MNVLWCITGAGHLLEESCKAAKKLAEKNRVTPAFSDAGLEVARMYGLLEEFMESFPEIIYEKDQGASSPVVGRLAREEYGKVIVAPCTANTTAKIVYGIADSLVSNIVAQAGKSKVPVYVLPTDAVRLQETVIPVSINLEKCTECRPCNAMAECPEKALYISGRIRVDHLKCTGCKKCVASCVHGAVESGKKVLIECREIDLENSRKLSGIAGITMLKDLDGILR